MTTKNTTPAPITKREAAKLARIAAQNADLRDEKRKQIEAAGKLLGFYTIQDRASYALPRAQLALTGLTHYVDDNTLRAFKCRILNCYITDDGLHLILRESLPAGSFNAKRGQRVVLFDFTGYVIDKGEFLSPKASEKEYYAQCNKAECGDFNMALHDRLREKAAYQISNATQALKIIRGKK
jgi:hypothetical protein